MSQVRIVCDFALNNFFSSNKNSVQQKRLSSLASNFKFLHLETKDLNQGRPTRFIWRIYMFQPESIIRRCFIWYHMQSIIFLVSLLSSYMFFLLVALPLTTVFTFLPVFTVCSRRVVLNNQTHIIHISPAWTRISSRKQINNTQAGLVPHLEIMRTFCCFSLAIHPPQ